MRLSAHEQRLVEQARPTVEHLARSAKRRFAEIPFEDFVSTGNQALVEVVRQYDPAFGVPFDVFAFKRVRGAMLRNTPQEVFGPLHIMIKKALAVPLEPPPSELSMAEALEDAPHKAKARATEWARQQAAAMLVAALQAAVSPAPDAERTESAESRTHSVKVLARVRQGLSEEEQYFLDRHYRDEASFEVIAGELGVVRRTVARMHDRLKKKLASLLRAEGIDGPPPPSEH